ncbi:type VI secretion system-associated protein TagF [Pseudomaricurvus sp.]|uniref:type VI secretion system-associated protein TagF n=1 Tax=Pseudomaricurvus sp. TaxID=2004510 RepID=UPI003F6CA08B
MDQNSLGLFGKIPAHGDFIERNLQRSFSLQWDDWLQRCIASSREQLGESWLDIYLTSPIWRFCLSVGAVDSLAWSGILMPSVDSVGRYYPLTIAQPVPGRTNPFEFIATNDSWYESVEQVALSALQSHLTADDLIQTLHQVVPAKDCSPGHSSAVIGLENGEAANTDTLAIESTYAKLLHHTLSPQNESQSLWWSRGSHNMQPTALHTKGLPTSQQFSAFLDGHWKNHTTG